MNRSPSVLNVKTRPATCINKKIFWDTVNFEKNTNEIYKFNLKFITTNSFVLLYRLIKIVNELELNSFVQHFGYIKYTIGLKNKRNSHRVEYFRFKIKKIKYEKIYFWKKI